MTRCNHPLNALPPRLPDVIIAHAALIVPGDRMVEMPVEDSDPELPWLRPRTVPMIWLRWIGPLALIPSSRGQRIGAVLFDTTSAPPETIQRRLMYTSSYTSSRTAQVWFRDEHDAGNQLADVVVAGGALPPEWSWNPPAEFGSGDWLPRRLKRAEVLFGVSAFQWQGAGAGWVIESGLDTVLVKRNGRFVKDASGLCQDFPSLEAAKAFCEEQDRAAL
jgi:hypothetical protein